MNFGVSEEEAKRKAKEVFNKLGYRKTFCKGHLLISLVGQMRRVAIAGVLAMEPEVIVLDEPTAGLDPRGRKEIMNMFYQLHKDNRFINDSCYP